MVCWSREDRSYFLLERSTGRTLAHGFSSPKVAEEWAEKRDVDVVKPPDQQ